MKDNTGTPGNEKLKEALEEFNRTPIQFSKEEKIKLTESIEMIMPNGLKRWIKIRVSGKGFTIEEAATDAKTKFEKALNVVLSNPSPTPSITDYNTGEQIVSREIPSIDPKKETLKEIIADCNTFEELIRIKPDCDKYGLWQEYLAKYESIEYINSNKI